MRICFAVQSNHGDALHDPGYCETHPLGGTETAVLKMAQALRELGAEATIATKPSQFPSAPVDVFVAARLWELFQDKPPIGKLNYLWCQDDADQPRLLEMRKPEVAEQVYKTATA